MMTKDEAIHKALKVLNCLNNDRVYETAWVKGAINACEEALEQPAEEPVGLKKALQMSREESKKAFEPKKPTGYLYSNHTWLSDETDPLKTGVPFYTEQIYAVIPCTHPHQWQGLTEDEIKILLASVGWIFPDSIKTTDSDYSLKAVLEAYKKIVSAIRAIEQALKEKNHG